jgi:preprotein translocase subunit SecE
VEERTISLVQETKDRLKRGYVRELKEELKRVSWTSREELFLSTKIVVGATFAFGLGVYLVDLCVRGGLNGLQALVLTWIG